MKIVVGMSGGVDSSVAAALLKQQGHDVTGVTMKIWSGEAAAVTGRHGCYGPADTEDIADAARVAASLGIPHHVIDLTGDYKHEVLDYFCDEYLAGRTPNPCVRCNHLIKFGVLVTKARQHGLAFERFATGHYARVEHDPATGRYLLQKARDAKKDQSYYLSALTQEQLSMCLFPLGDMTKDEVRRLALDFGLDVARKPESQDFAEMGYESLLPGQGKPGPVVDAAGKVLGTHRGIQFYTIGQRKGLGIASEKPLYVVAIDAASNTVTVGGREQVYASECAISGINWISVAAIAAPTRFRVKIRYAHQEADATVTPLPGGDSVHVQFDTPQLAIAPGQTAVFYDGNTVAAGGTIERTTHG